MYFLSVVIIVTSYIVVVFLCCLHNIKRRYICQAFFVCFCSDF
nr:MAG TPA: chitin synthase regulator [Bacteriophage sp.]